MKLNVVTVKTNYDISLNIPKIAIIVDDIAEFPLLSWIILIPCISFSNIPQSFVEFLEEIFSDCLIKSFIYSQISVKSI